MDTRELRQAIEPLKAEPDVAERLARAFPEMNGVRCQRGLGSLADKSPCLILYWENREPPKTMNTTIRYRAADESELDIPVVHAHVGAVVADDG